jgi:hypothetical protein
MKKALSEACRLGNNTACDDLKNLKRVHGHDFGLSIIDQAPIQTETGPLGDIDEAMHASTSKHKVFNGVRHFY